MNSPQSEKPPRYINDIHLAEAMAYGEKPRRALARIALEHELIDRSVDHLEWADKQGEVAGRKYIEKIRSWELEDYADELTQQLETGQSQREHLHTISIDVLGLSLRVSNLLKRNNIHSVGRLVKYTEQELVDSINNFGWAAVGEVVERLKPHGLSLKKD